MCHGRGSSKDSSAYTVLEKILLSQGVASFRFDQRGHGDSRGKFEELTVSGIVDDTTSAIDHLFNKHLHIVNKNRLILYGTSLSGFTCVVAAAKDARVKYLIVRSGVFDFRKVYSRAHDVKAWKERGYTRVDSQYFHQVKLNYSFYTDGLGYSYPDYAKRITVPTLILQGTQDIIVTPENSKNLFKYLGSKDKTLKLINGADHDYRGHRDEMQQTIVDWIKEKVLL